MRTAGTLTETGEKIALLTVEVRASEWILIGTGDINGEEKEPVPIPVGR